MRRSSREEEAVGSSSNTVDYWLLITDCPVCILGRKRSLFAWAERRWGNLDMPAQWRHVDNKSICTFVQLCWSHVCLPQGDQGLQGPPGPFEYVDPPEDLYVKGEQVESIVSTMVLWSSTQFALLYTWNAGSLPVLLQFSSKAQPSVVWIVGFVGSNVEVQLVQTDLDV